jgi:DNA-binding transcriptional ArsR family regulator
MSSAPYVAPGTLTPTLRRSLNRPLVVRCNGPVALASMSVLDSRPQQSISLRELDRVVLEPILSPMPTAVEAVRDVVSNRPAAVLTRWQRQALRGSLTRRQIRALAALRPTSAPSDGGPNPLLESAATANMRDELDRVSATDPDSLGLAVETATKAGRPTAPWMLLHRDPAGWLETYLAGLKLVWAEVRPIWVHARDRLEREADRIQAASERGAAVSLLAAAGMPGRVERGELRLPSHTEDSGRLRVVKTLRLVPLVAVRPAEGWCDDYADHLLSLRYGFAAETERFTGRPAAPGSLEALLGGTRAAILLGLDLPRHPGQLAERLLLTPSGVTHHLAALEAAELISRHREGRNVIVRRTSRATALLAIYDRA